MTLHIRADEGTAVAQGPEATNRELDGLLAKQFHARQVLLVYADWLEERGDPQGALIQHQLRVEDDEARQRQQSDVEKTGSYTVHPGPDRRAADELITRHWSRWFGALPADSVQFDWAHGFVRRARLLSPRGLPTLRALLGRPALRFLRALEVDVPAFHGTMAGVEVPLTLEEVTWHVRDGGVVAPLGDGPLPSLTRLRLTLSSQPTDEDLDGLRRLTAPRLRRLDLTANVPDEPGFIAGLTAMPALAALTSLDLSLKGGGSLAGLHALRVGKGAGGRGLILRLPASRMTAARAELRRALPEACLSPVPEGQNDDHTYGPPGPVAHDKPAFAKAEFKDLQPWAKQSNGKGDEVWMGRGAPANDWQLSPFQLCASCASGDTQVIYRSASSRDLNSYESMLFETKEYLCRECGRYTSYRYMLTTG